MDLSLQTQLTLLRPSRRRRARMHLLLACVLLPSALDKLLRVSLRYPEPGGRNTLLRPYIGHAIAETLTSRDRLGPTRTKSALNVQLMQCRRYRRRSIIKCFQTFLSHRQFAIYYQLIWPQLHHCRYLLAP